MSNFKKNQWFLGAFLASNHYFCKAKSFLEKVPDFVPGFLGETLIGQKWCTLSSAQLEENKKKLWNHYFSAVIWRCFDVLNKVLFEKLTGDVSKNTIFLQVF